MQLGEIIANAFSAILSVCALVIVFLVAGGPLFPRRQVRMVVVLPAGPDAAAAISNSNLDLPATFDLAIAPPRPAKQG